MGFYLRGSVKAGPFRFNMGRSGLGVSVGVPGFRVGSGPRGNYVNIGGQGVYYRATPGTVSQNEARPLPAPVHRPSDILMEDLTGATSMSLVPTGSGDIVEQLNTAAARHGLAWPATIAVLVLGASFMPYGLILWALAVPLCWYLFLRDKARRTVVLFYDVNDAPAAWFDALVTDWRLLTGSQRLWRVVQSGRVRTTYQHKTNAGASALVNRIPATANTVGPKHLSTNVAIPSLVAGSSSLHFLADRVLMRTASTTATSATATSGPTGARNASSRALDRSRVTRSNRPDMAVRERQRRTRPPVLEQLDPAGHALRSSRPQQPSRPGLATPDLSR